MRTPSPGPYDVVLNLWTSFGYLPTPADDAEALAAWRRALVPGGTLVMELTIRERAEHENRRGDEPVSTKKATTGMVTETSWYDWTESLAHVTYTRPGWSRTCRTRMYTRDELHAMLTAAGFSAVLPRRLPPRAHLARPPHRRSRHHPRSHPVIHRRDVSDITAQAERDLLAAHQLNSADLIATGTEAKVYLLDSEQVLKVYGDPDGSQAARLQALRAFYDRLDRDRVPYALPEIRSV